MTLPLVLAPEAEDDLEDAANWYEMQQPGLGEAFLRSLDASLARIHRLPKAFHLEENGIRTAFLHRFPYAVRFRLTSERIEVVAVWHERRDPEAWKRRRKDGAS